MSHSPPDPSEADDTQRGTGEVRAEQGVHAPGFPTTRAHLAFTFHHPAGSGHQQGKGEVSGGISQNAGRIAHRDAAGGGGGYVHVIHADSAIADDFQPRPGSLHHFGVNLISQQAQQPFWQWT